MSFFSTKIFTCGLRFKFFYMHVRVCVSMCVAYTYTHQIIDIFLDSYLQFNQHTLINIQFILNQKRMFLCYK